MGIPAVSEWADFMPQTVQIAPWTGYSGGGAGQSYGADVGYSCRIEMGNHLIVDTHGRTITASGMVFLETTTTISTKDRVTLPSSYVPTQPPILQVDVEDDETGNHHVVLHVGVGS